MSKELEALKRVKYNSSKEVVDAFDVIENALKRLEAIDNAKPSEALTEIFNIIYNLDCGTTYEQDKKLDVCRKTIEQALIEYQFLKECFSNFEDHITPITTKEYNNLIKKEQAFDIIKEKCVDVGYVIMSFIYKDYNSKMDELWGDKATSYYLTEEEFKLLKEAFLK